MTTNTNPMNQPVQQPQQPDVDALLLERLRQFFPTLDQGADVNQVLDALVTNTRFVQALPPEIETADQIVEMYQSAQAAQQAPVQQAPVEPPPAPSSTGSFSFSDKPEDFLKPLEIHPAVAQFCQRDPRTGMWVSRDPYFQKLADDSNAIERQAAMRVRQFQYNPAGVLEPLIEQRVAKALEDFQKKIQPVQQFHEQETFSREITPIQDRLFTTDPTGKPVPTAEGQTFLWAVDMGVKAGMSKAEAAREAIARLNLAAAQQPATHQEPLVPQQQAPAPFIPQQQAAPSQQTQPSQQAPANNRGAWADAKSQADAATQPAAAPVQQTQASATQPAPQQTNGKANGKQKFVDDGRQAPHNPIGTTPAGGATRLPDYSAAPGPLPNFKEIAKQVDAGVIPIESN